MNKFTPIALFFLVTATTLTAGCNTVATPQQSTTVSSTTSNPDNPASTFQDRKTRILNHINERLSMIQQIQSCVQAANDMKAMKACKPHRDKNHRWMHHHE